MHLCTLSIEELSESAKQLICFGSGKAFDKFFELFEDRDLVNRVKYIVDNDEKRQGKMKKCGKREIPVVAPSQFINDTHELNTICLIVLKDKDAILNQYVNVLDYGSLTAVWYMDIMREYCTRMFDEVPLVADLHRNNTMIIPKKIHYCWFGGKAIPSENKEWMDSWRKYCQDYEIIQWDESNYNVKKNKYMKQAYETRQFAFVSDYARLDILYREGGIYLDTDVELIKNIDDLLYQTAFFGWEDGLRVATGLGFGAVSGFELLKEMRDYYDNLSFIKDDGSIDFTACPTFQTRVLQRHGLKKDGSYQIIEDAAILPVTYLCGKASYLLKETRTDYTYAIHHFQGSGRL